jgi:hypothetical protein
LRRGLIVAILYKSVLLCSRRAARQPPLATLSTSRFRNDLTMAKDPTSSAPGTFVAPHPGSKQMPRWDTGPLIEAPRFNWRNLAAMIGPGLVMGGSAIGGGEWLLGPLVTARYGGSLLWLATLSILAQVVYNIEISRYTLYSGEPIFTGKARSLPGPIFWLGAYVLLDMGSIFPYLASTAATPLASVMLGRIPNPKLDELNSFGVTDATLLQALGIVIFWFCLTPLIVGGKVYNSIKAVMTFKLVVVLGFLLLVAVCFSDRSTWFEIFSGFFEFGSVPVEEGTGPGGANVDNYFTAWREGRSLPVLNLSVLGLLCAMVSISGNGGLSNTPISNYTRDQGWGMGHHVGAIPSVVGGHNLKLSHVGMVFEVNEETLPRWRRWYRHLVRDQVLMWMPACFIGLALPSMLSVQFLPRGTQAESWTAAGMTAGGVSQSVAQAWGPSLGNFFWFMTLFCGFLVLAPSMVSTADGVCRRWVDVFWTSLPWLRQFETRAIRKVYFGVLCGYAVFGTTILILFPNGGTLVQIATMIYNYALGFSCLHTLYLNTALLPRELRPGWFIRIALSLSGLFFLAVAALTTYSKLVG